MTEAGSAEKKDPKMVALQEVIDRLNDLFGAEEFTASQPESFVRALIDRMLENDALVLQARVNSVKQFAESPDFDEAVVDAVADSQGAHNKRVREIEASRAAAAVSGRDYVVR
jgi:type I restriction enzyme R subunit